MHFPADSVIQIIRLLEENGVPVWLDGGWGIDALLKMQKREHLDLDLIVPVDSLSTAESVLKEVGFSKNDSLTLMPTRFVLHNSDELEIDIRPVTLKPDSSAEHIDVDDNMKSYTFVYSAAGLSGVGLINGRIVHCTSAGEQVRQKLERRYSFWKRERIRPSGISADIQDLINLRDQLGATWLWKRLRVRPRYPAKLLNIVCNVLNPKKYSEGHSTTLPGGPA